jgi:hypothetical protein
MNLRSEQTWKVTIAKPADQQLKFCNVTAQIGTNSSVESRRTIVKIHAQRRSLLRSSLIDQPLPISWQTMTMKESNDF